MFIINNFRLSSTVSRLDAKLIYSTFGCQLKMSSILSRSTFKTGFIVILKSPHIQTDWFCFFTPETEEDGSFHYNSCLSFVKTHCNHKLIKHEARFQLAVSFVANVVYLVPQQILALFLTSEWQTTAFGFTEFMIIAYRFFIMWFRKHLHMY